MTVHTDKKKVAFLRHTGTTSPYYRHIGCAVIKQTIVTIGRIGLCQQTIPSVSRYGYAYSYIQWFLQIRRT